MLAISHYDCLLINGLEHRVAEGEGFEALERLILKDLA
jgi:hypothetical protein